MPIKHVFSQITRYKAVWLWFVKDAYWRFSGLTIKIILYMAASMALLVLALGVIYKYVDGLEQGKELVILSNTYQFQTSLELLFLVILGAGLLFGGSALLRYIAGVSALQLGRRYEEQCILRAASFLAITNKTESLAPWLSEAGKLIQSAPRFCGRVARLSIMAVLPAMTFIVTLALLAYLDPFVTLAVILIIAITIPFLYAVNVKGARYSRTLERTMPVASQARRKILDHCIEQDGFVSPDSDWMKAHTEKGPLFDNFNAYVGRLRAVANGMFVTQVMFGVGIVAIIWQMGGEIIETGSGWGTLATYLVALRINLASFSTASTNLTGVNRFYPQVHRYFSFVRDVNKVLKTTPETQQQYDATLGGILDEAPVETGEESTQEEFDWNGFIPKSYHRLAIEVPPSAPDWYVSLVVAEVFNDTTEKNVYIATSGNADIAFRKMLGIDDTDDEEGDLLDESMNDRNIETIESQEKGQPIAIVDEILSAAKSGYTLIVIELSEWLLLDNQSRSLLNKALIGINLILLSRDGAMIPGKHGVTFAIATDGKGMLIQSDISSFDKMVPMLEILRGKTSATQNSSSNEHDDEHLED